MIENSSDALFLAASCVSSCLLMRLHALVSIQDGFKCLRTLHLATEVAIDIEGNSLHLPPKVRFYSGMMKMHLAVPVLQQDNALSYYI